jgi:FkbM family methyltransferase
MADLVFDIGMHNGQDTAYYLASGYEVVAVEANPVLCEAAGERFRQEIAAGQLTVRNVGIAEEAGNLDFWVSDNSEWSSFHKENATREDTGASVVSVSTLQFADLLAQYHAPLYVKVDIEMNDSLCIRDLSRCEALPKYFSFEGHMDAAADVDVLAGLGYTSFKCVRQVDWREINPENMHRQASIRKLLARAGRVPRIAPYLRALHYRARPVNGWKFAPGSSGPLGRDMPGRWLSRDEVLEVWEHRLTVDREMGAGGLGEWFDIHALAASS